MLDYKPLKRLPGTRKEYVRKVRTICQECTVGCGLVAYVQDERVVDVHGDEDHPVSRGRLCAKGIAFVQALRHPDRVTLPGTRNRLQGPFEAFDNWEKGLDQLAERLRRVKDQHGPESLVIACSPMAGLDFLLGARRFARLWGTPHVYNPLDDTKALAGKLAVNSPTAPCSDWKNSKCLFLVEADLAATHPVAFQWVLEAKKNGAKIIAADIRYTATLSKADKAYMIAPESESLLGAYLMKALIDEGLIDEEAVEANLEEVSDWKASYEKMSMDDAQKAVGLAPEKILEIARQLARKGPVTVITGKRLAFRENYGIWPTLATAMGWFGKPGGGWYPMESGVAVLDAEKKISEDDAEETEKSEKSYPYQTTRHHRIPDEDHGFKAMICSGNALDKFMSPFKKAARDMELNVFFGAFPNVTRDLAHMVFPSTLWPERYGVCFNNDRIIQWGERIVMPSDACRTGLGFWMRLAQRLGWEEFFPWKKTTGLADHEAFYDFVLSNSPDTAGISLEQIKENPGAVSWPTAGIINDQAPLFKTESGKMQPAKAPGKAVPSADDSEKEYPLYYQATRVASRYSDPSHWQPWTREIADEKAVQIHPDAAKALGVENGDEIVIAANGDQIEGRAWISRMVRRDMVWSTRRLLEDRVLVYKKGGDSEQALNNLRELLQ